MSSNMQFYRYSGLIEITLLVSWIVYSLASGDTANAWGYQGKHGPSHWYESNPRCVGARQSPVDIREDHVTYEDLGQIFFGNYNNELLGMRLKNNGHAAQVDITRKKAYIKGSSLADQKYQLAQFHFHWGSDSTKGSEHTYEGKAYPAELHFVHFNTRYQNLSQAADKEPFGLAVLGVFIEVGETDNPAFTNIINALVNVTHPGSQQEIESVRLDALLPSNTEDYYRYQGSLTTPPCYESVQWTVFKTPVQLSETQLGEFRKLLSSGAYSLVNNYRPTQFVKFRSVYSDFSRP